MVGLHHSARRAHGHRPLDLVLQLADVSRPPVSGQQVERRRRELNPRLVQPFARLSQEKRAEVGNFLLSIAQRRHVDSNHAEAVVQVLSKPALRHTLLQVGVGGREDPDVDPLGPRLTDRRDLALFEKPEQLRLNVKRKIADFVEKQRAVPGGSDDTGLVRHRAGKAAASMTKQLAVSHIACRGRAVVGEEHGGTFWTSLRVSREPRGLCPCRSRR